VFRHTQSTLTFEHDGAAFTSQELAALLSGGSSKEFESEITTGRFGTGFLVTHVLAEHTTLRGLLKVSDGYEHFELALDRSGNEESILNNINACKETIRIATPISDLNGIPSASFEYSIDDDRTLLVGLDALRQALPYLYITRPSLGRVEFDLEGFTEVWTPGDLVVEIYCATVVQHRSIRLERNGVTHSELQTYRFIQDDEAACPNRTRRESIENILSEGLALSRLISCSTANLNPIKSAPRFLWVKVTRRYSRTPSMRR
jgi:hypothetical protein